MNELLNLGIHKYIIISILSELCKFLRHIILSKNLSFYGVRTVTY